MNERLCERCGKNITHKPHTIAEDVLGICSECAGDLDEFMNGAPLLKWNFVKVRPITDEEKAEQIELGADPDALDGWIEGLTPEDGQEVLISFKNGDIGFDTVYADELGVYFDNGYEWEDVAAWAIPDPYVPGEEKNR